MSGQEDDLASVTPDDFCVLCKIKRKKNSETSVIRKKPIGDTVNPSKKAK